MPDFVSERREAYRAFFQVLLDELRERHNFTGARVALPENYYHFSSGTSAAAYGFSFARGREVRAEVILNTKEQEENKAHFDSLAQEKTILESQFGEPLRWERLDKKVWSRVAVYRPGTIDDDREILEEIRGWAIDRLLKLKKVFGPRLAKSAR